VVSPATYWPRETHLVLEARVYPFAPVPCSSTPLGASGASLPFSHTSLVLSVVLAHLLRPINFSHASCSTVFEFRCFRLQAEPHSQRVSSLRRAEAQRRLASKDIWGRARGLLRNQGQRTQFGHDHIGPGCHPQVPDVAVFLLEVQRFLHEQSWSVKSWSVVPRPILALPMPAPSLPAGCQTCLRSVSLPAPGPFMFFPATGQVLLFQACIRTKYPDTPETQLGSSQSPYSLVARFSKRAPWPNFLTERFEGLAMR